MTKKGQPRPVYDTVYHRLVSNTEDPSNEQGCWSVTTRKDRGGYGRFTLYVPGMGRHTRITLQAHVVMWIVSHLGLYDADDIFLAALEIRYSRLEVDHLCHNPSCINPDHLDGLVTHVDNCARRRDAWRTENPVPREVLEAFELEDTYV